MSWTCLVLPSLAIDGALRRRPPLDAPFALVDGPTQQRRLVALNKAARAAGLRPGQRLAEAEIICRNLVVEQSDRSHIESDLLLVAAWAYGFSSQVLVLRPRAIALEVGGSLRLFGAWPSLVARLRQGLDELGFRHRIARAPNPCAAQVLAGMHDGVDVVGDAALIQALDRIPVDRAGLPATMAEALPGMGVDRLRQVIGLPRAALKRRFGAAALETIDRILGRLPHAFPAWQPPPRFAGRIELGAEVSDQAMLLFPLKRLLSDLAACLTARDGGVDRLVIRCLHEHGAATDIEIGFLAAERAASALFDVARLKLERSALPAPVIAIEVLAESLPPFVPEGRDLFDTRPAHALPFAQLDARLRARLGQDSVHGCAADPDPRPERAQIDVPCTAPMPPLPRRPTWLLKRPILLRGPAPRILAGPERLETGWWDGGDIRRDYYIVETAAGQRAWVFCAPGERGGFMLHGWFA